MNQISKEKVINAINPSKDVDGFHPMNVGNLSSGYDEIKINNDLKITLLPAVHWSKRSLMDMNKTLWGNFLIEYKNKKILFACDTGYGNIYKD